MILVDVSRPAPLGMTLNRERALVGRRRAAAVAHPVEARAAPRKGMKQGCDQMVIKRQIRFTIQSVADQGSRSNAQARSMFTIRPVARRYRVEGQAIGKAVNLGRAEEHPGALGHRLPHVHAMAGRRRGERVDANVAAEVEEPGTRVSTEGCKDVPDQKRLPGTKVLDRTADPPITRRGVGAHRPLKTAGVCPRPLATVRIERVRCPSCAVAVVRFCGVTCTAAQELNSIAGKSASAPTGDP